jgi:hypothetical protein
MPLLAAVLVACAPKSEPRTVLDFMDDGLAREGVLTRCSQNRDETLNDEECNNARRAASTLALQAERARAPALEQQSEATLLAMRGRHADAAVTDSASAAPTFGSPVGSVLPSMSHSPSFDVYADGSSETLDRPISEIAAEPPANDLVIPALPLEVPELAVVPRPFRDETVQR